MNKSIAASMQMHSDVLAFFLRKVLEFLGFTDFDEDVDKLKGYITSNDEQRNIVENSTKGHTLTKNIAKNYVVTHALRPIASRLNLFANKNEMEILKNEIRYTEKQLLRRSDKRLPNILDIYAKNALALLPATGSEKITQVMIDDLNAGIADYRAKLIGTPQYHGELKAANKQIDNNMAGIKNLLEKNLDLTVEITKEDYPSSYVEYQSARRINLPPHRMLALKIQACESESLTPLAGVTFTVMSDTNGDGVQSSDDQVRFVKRSSRLGVSQMRNLADGKYLVTAVKPGFESKTVIIYKSSDKTCKVTIELNSLQ